MVFIKDKGYKHIVVFIPLYENKDSKEIQFSLRKKISFLLTGIIFYGNKSATIMP